MKHQKSKIWFILTGLISLCCSTSAFAITLQIKQFFEIAPKDTSLTMLKQIFGSVGTLLTGQPGLLNVMFKEFNNAMLALGTIVIMYTLFISLMNTAQQGEFLGKKFESMWVPVRSVAGFALVIPTASGYSMIQIFMMWVILQGVGAADTLWTTTLKYFQTGGTVAVVPITATPAKGIDTTANFYKGMICMHRQLYNTLTPEQQESPNAIRLDNLVPTIKHDITANKFMLEFRTFEDAPDKDPKCGIITWPTVEQATNDEEKAAYQALTGGMNYLIPALNNSAKEYVFHGASAVTATGINPLTAVTEYINNVIIAAVQLVQEAQQATGLSDWYEEAAEFGWANAGAYYRIIAGKNEAAQDNTDYSKYTITEASIGISTDDSDFVGQVLQAAKETSLGPTQMPNPTMPESSSTGFNWLTYAVNNLLKYTAYTALAAFLTGDANPNNPTEIFFANPSIDPIIKIQNLGKQIVESVMTAWGIGFITLLVTALFSYICSASNPAQGPYKVMLLFIIVPAMALLGILFVAGLTMEVYVPLIPYIIFTFGVIGWLIATIETMIAAPIVALGIIHPEGHEVYGRAEPAVQLILNVFMRPVFMLFGLFVGMILSFVAINFMNALFAKATNFANVDGAIEKALYVVIYVLLVIGVLNRCFSLIHLIPDNVLRWVSNQAAQFGQYMGGEEQVKGGFAAGAGEVKGAAYGQTQAGVSTAGQMFQGQKKDEEGKLEKK